MLKRIIILHLFLFSALCAISQVFHGRMVNKSGDPLPHATIYVREIHSGFVADENGYFRTTIRPGSYTCEASMLGYSKKSFSIHVPEKGLHRDVVLTEQVFSLPEVSISGSNEDPAYTVMRNAIANAPRHRYRVKTYTANTYLKGSGRLTGAPAIFKLSSDFRKHAPAFMNRTFLLEEQRKVVFTAPDSWDDEIIARSNSFPDEMQVMIGTTDVNLYAPKIFGRVSPLSAGAFSYYTFKLDGCYVEGEHLVNKVRVIPKKENQSLISGHIYIVDGLWCLSGTDIHISGLGVTARVRVVCNEVKPSLFLSTSINMESEMDMLGLKAKATYLSSIKYLDISVSDNAILSIGADSTGQRFVPRFDEEGQKATGKIAELLAKDDLTTREAYKLYKLMDKEIRKSDTIRSKHKYERKPRDFQVRTDSLADSRDSLYWEGVRSVPLSEEELAGYEYKKKTTADAEKDGQKRKNSFAKETLQVIMEGKTYQTRDKKAWLTVKDVRSMVPGFNFVDGFWVGAETEAGIRFSEASSLTFAPQAHYTTARKEWVAAGTLTLNYAPRHLGRLRVSGGSLSADYNGSGGESRLFNSYASLLFGRSDIKFYDRKYLTVDHRIEPFNSLIFTSALSWERRSLLENNYSRSAFGKKAKPNIPDNTEYTPMPESNLLKMTLSLTYTPARYYSMVRGVKMYESSSYPTFGVRYEQAFEHGGAGKTTPSYRRIEFSAWQKVEFGMFNNLYWYLNGGLTMDAKDMQFPDFRHFETTRLPVTERGLHTGFSRASNYEMSTDTRWAQGNVMWSTPYLLIKHLPFLRKKRFDEALHLRSLAAFNRKVYTELGYSIGLLDISRVGVFVSFDELKYNSTGVSVSFPFWRRR